MRSNTAKIPTRPKRQFVDEKLIVDSWKKLKCILNPYWKERLVL